MDLIGKIIVFYKNKVVIFKFFFLIDFRSLNAITGWIKICLSSEQKKTDFKPDSDIDTMTSLVSIYLF